MSRTEVYWYLKEKQFLKLLWSWTCGATSVIDYYEKKKCNEMQRIPVDQIKKYKWVRNV